MKSIAENIGYRIKTLREHGGFTQSNIAHYLKVDQSLISMVEKGTRALTSDLLDKLADLFGVQPSVLGQGDMGKKPISFALRASEIREEDLETIGAINRIALNSRFMAQLLEGDLANG